MTRANAINRLLLRYWYKGHSERELTELLEQYLDRCNGDIERAYLNCDITMELNHQDSKRVYNVHEIAILLGISAEQAGREYPNGLRASDIVQIQGLTAADTAV